MCTFHNRVGTGEFDNIPDDDYRQVVGTMEFIGSLWRYPDAKEGENTVFQMNGLCCLAIPSKQSAGRKPLASSSNPLSAGRDGGENRPLLCSIWKHSEKSIVIYANIWYDNNERRAISYAQI